MVRPTLQPWSAAALLLLLSSALLLSSRAHLVEGLQLPSQASLTGLRIRLQSAFASSPSSSPPSRVLGDAAQVDVPFDYSYFNTFLNSECSPAYVDAQGKPHKASTGFPGSCPRTIPWSDPKIAPAPPSVPSSSGSSSSPLNCSSTPEQVALKWWGTREGGPAVLISWVTCGGSYSMPPATPPATPPPAPPPLDTAAAPPSTLHVGAAPGVYDREVPAVSFSYTVDYSSRFDLSAWQPLSNPPPGPPPPVAAPSLAQEGGGTYISPVVHHALVRGLKPGEPVFYRIAGPPSSSSSPLSSAARSVASFSGQFQVPGGTFPLRVGVVGDPGQTFNTSTTFDFLLSGGGVGGGGKKPDVVLMPGDLTYADNSGDWNMYFNWAQAEAISENINPFSPRWDAFGRLVSPLAAAVPILTAPGNHEVEQTPDNALYPVQAGWRNDAFLTRFANYLARYPSPQTTQQVSFLFMRAPERERARERAQARSRGRARGRAQRARERARACEWRSPEARAHETFFFFKKKKLKTTTPKTPKGPQRPFRRRPRGHHALRPRPGPRAVLLHGPARRRHRRLAVDLHVHRLVLRLGPDVPVAPPRARGGRQGEHPVAHRPDAREFLLDELAALVRGRVHAAGVRAAVPRVRRRPRLQRPRPRLRALRADLRLPGRPGMRHGKRRRRKREKKGEREREGTETEGVPRDMSHPAPHL